MAARPRNAAVPAALRPKNAPAPRPPQEPVPDPDAITVHVAILIDHPKIYDAIKDRIRIVGPQYQPIDLQAHVILDDHRHKAKDIDPRVRMALVELGLVRPEDIGFTYPGQVTLGWPEPKD